MALAEQASPRCRRPGAFGRPVRRILGRLAPVLLTLVLLGCSTITLVSRYDEQTDQSVTAFGKKMDTFLGSLERNAGKPAVSYDANVDFYEGAHVDIRAMQVRAQAIPKNDLTVGQLAELMASLDDLEKLHKIKKDGIPADQIPVLRTAFQRSCGAILKLELAKKRGETK